MYHSFQDEANDCDTYARGITLPSMLSHSLGFIGYHIQDRYFVKLEEQQKLIGGHCWKSAVTTDKLKQWYNITKKRITNNYINVHSLGAGTSFTDLTPGTRHNVSHQVVGLGMTRGKGLYTLTNSFSSHQLG